MEFFLHSLKWKGQELEDEFGISIRQYYNFLNFLTVSNIALLLCSLIGKVL